MWSTGWPAASPLVEGSREHRCCPLLKVTFPVPAGSWAQPTGCRTLAAAGPWRFSDVDREQWSGAGSRDTGRPSGTTKNFSSSMFSDEAVPGVLFFWARFCLYTSCPPLMDFPCASGVMEEEPAPSFPCPPGPTKSQEFWPGQSPLGKSVT